MSKKNKNMRGWYGDGSEVDNYDWWSPVETTYVEDNSWMYNQQLENERIAREQAEAEAAYQAYLNQLDAEIEAQRRAEENEAQRLEAERQAEAARAYQRYLNQLEAERQAKEARAYQAYLNQLEAERIESVRIA